MSRCDELLELPPFGVDSAVKERKLKAALYESFEHHYGHCPEYRRLCDARDFHLKNLGFDYSELPFIPVDLFKKMKLRSVRETDVVRTLHSSATSSSIASTVFLDQTTRQRQVRSLGSILSHYLGRERRPFLVLDSDSLSQDDAEISARVAALRGFLIAAKSAKFTLDIGAFLSEIAALGQQVFVLFGYTYVVYAHLIEELRKRGVKLQLPNAVLLHIGGWKKLSDRTVSKEKFNADVHELLGISKRNILDAYGFTEQLGIIYVDRPDEPKRCPTYSEILIRDSKTLKVVTDGGPGLIQMISPLPHSYPGFSVLLDDVGRIVDQGTSAFEILGRAKQNAIKGCGDVMGEQMRLNG